MNRSQYTFWLPIGLYFLANSFASAVNAAMLEDVPRRVAGEDIWIAQITPDDTLGAEASVVTPDVSIQGDLADQIEGGAVRGDNLFHSFQEFNVNTGQRVYFANPSGIENILGRVNGGNLSNIDGLLGVNGGANLFLLNPNGIVFGPNAELDIRGSFLASTGDRFTFADGSGFSATNPQAGALLTVSVPLGVQYGVNPGSIINQGDLSVVQDLTLAAGTVTHTGALATDFGNLVIDGVVGDVVLQGNTASTVGNTTLQASNRVEVNNSSLQSGGQLTVEGNQAIDIANSTVSSGRDMVFRAPVRQLGNGTTFRTGGYFITKELDGSLVDFLIPHEQVIVAAGDVQFTQNYTGPSLYILAGGSVAATADVTDIEITGTGDGAVTAIIGDGLGGVQQMTVNSWNQPTLDIRAGIDWNQMPGTLPESAAIAGIRVSIDSPAGSNVQLDTRVCFKTTTTS